MRQVNRVDPSPIGPTIISLLKDPMRSRTIKILPRPRVSSSSARPAENCGQQIYIAIGNPNVSVFTDPHPERRPCSGILSHRTVSPDTVPSLAPITSSSGTLFVTVLPLRAGMTLDVGVVAKSSRRRLSHPIRRRRTGWGPNPACYK